MNRMCRHFAHTYSHQDFTITVSRHAVVFVRQGALDALRPKFGLLDTGVFCSDHRGMLVAPPELWMAVGTLYPIALWGRTSL